MEDLTPMMKQYHEVKRRFPGKLVFFRLGDFYEMFYEDAVLASRELEITLTSRNKDKSGAPIPMCGVPYHSVDGYIARLMKKGYKIAIYPLPRITLRWEGYDYAATAPAKA